MLLMKLTQRLHTVNTIAKMQASINNNPNNTAQLVATMLHGLSDIMRVI